MTLISLLIFVLILGVVWWIVQALPIDGKFKQIALVIVGLIALVYLLQALGVMSGGPLLR